MPTSAFYSVIDGFVVNVNWSGLQPTQGGPINGAPIDQAISQARQANAGGAHLAIKIRIFAGIAAPSWAKNLGGAPYTARDPNSGASGTVGRFWTPAFGQAFQDLQNKLAAKYDSVPEIREIVMGRCTTIYDEPMIRQISDPTTVANLLAAGYTVAADVACQQQQIQAHAVWTHTRSVLAFNPYQVVSASKVGSDVLITEQLMTFCRQTLGLRCILENNSLRTTPMGTAYAQMYAAMHALGPNIAFQTATIAKVGSLIGTLVKAVALGAASVELPSGYQSMSPAALAAVRLQLAANARL